MRRWGAFITDHTAPNYSRPVRPMLSHGHFVETRTVSCAVRVTQLHIPMLHGMILKNASLNSPRGGDSIWTIMKGSRWLFKTMWRSTYPNKATSKRLQNLPTPSLPLNNIRPRSLINSDKLLGHKPKQHCANYIPTRLSLIQYYGFLTTQVRVWY